MGVSAARNMRTPAIFEAELLEGFDTLDEG